MSPSTHALPDDDSLSFAEDDDAPAPAGEPWKVLIVDDEEEIHAVTRLALRHFTFEGRGLHLMSAHSAREARAAITEHPDTALILLDVVMEEEDAGLRVVRFLRDEQKNHMTRIVLRTGQPGQAPEHEVIVSYDINDYKSKTELSRQKLFTTVVASLRSFRDLRRIAEAHAQLEQALQAQRAMSDAAERFVPHDLLRILNKQSITDVRLGENTDRVMAIMFSDIRGFSGLAERMTPQENFNFVNEYFGRTGPIVRLHHGFVLKYMGDGLMAGFPEGGDDALLAGIDILKSLSAFNDERTTEGRPQIHIGIGLHVGPVRLGIVGESDRVQGDAISDEVNLASRLEGLTKDYGVPFLLTEPALAGLADRTRFKLRHLGTTRVRGMEQPVSVYECFDADPAEQRALKQQTLAAFEQAVARYLAGDLWGAGAAFQELSAANPQDRAVAYYLRQTAGRLAQGATSAG
ncbi:MAG: adenylate/guanylate cyclase domain-containing protein [Vicinamibacterales bacterium]